VVVLDLECRPASLQLEFFNELRELQAPVVVITDGDRAGMLELARRGIQNYCRKPLSVPELKIVVRRAHEHTMLNRAAEDGRASSSPPPGRAELVGSSAGSKAVYDLIERAAGIDAPVLITGESGTGKELIARAIHATGERRSQPFVALSCGAIPESLFEAELFGSEKGAFTGSSARRIGYCEQAGAGTLFLDEIGELSPHAQVKLLRVLQQREFMRLGSSTAVPLRARMLFATNRNLKQMVAAGEFREDLYYRLNVIRIHSQPLRNRADDIPQLAEHFVRTYAPAYGKSITGIRPEAMALLREHGWPGNVRELENVIQSAIILSDGEDIVASNLPEELQQTRTSVLNDALEWISFEDQLSEYKTRLAVAAVEKCNGNKTLAAQNLNISRTYLHRLIREPGEDGLTLRVA
jgi:DNA-binding NtrC family response regulator